MQLYILKDRVPVEADSFSEWGEWFATANRQVALTRMTWPTSPTAFEVSTVFIGANERQLFETARFRSEDGDVTIVGRCDTWDAAEAMHAQAVAELRGIGFVEVTNA